MKRAFHFEKEKGEGGAHKASWASSILGGDSMSELEDKINSLLSSPEDMSRIMQLAKSIMPGEGESTAGGTEQDAGAAGSGLDAGLMASIGKLMGGGDEKKDSKRALLNAMTPYLGEERRRKMKKAMQIAKIASVAGAFFSESGDADV